MTGNQIEAVAFDCYGTLIDFGDEAFAHAYGQICSEQGIAVDGKTFFNKWMEIWRRLAESGSSADGGTVGVVKVAASVPDRPAPLSEAEPSARPDPAWPAGRLVEGHPQHHTPSAGRNRSLDGRTPPYRPYREEWPEHFALCFEELGVKGDAQAAHNRLVELLSQGRAFPEAHQAVEAVRNRLPVALLSNADDDFLRPCLAANGLEFPVVVSSETARAYKPHVAIFTQLSKDLGIPLQRILYVGDSRFADVVGAKNAGLQAAWVNRRGGPNRPLEATAPARNGSTADILQRFPPDYEISSLDGVFSILDGGD